MISDWQGSVRFDTSKICCYIRHSKGILIYIYYKGSLSWNTELLFVDTAQVLYGKLIGTKSERIFVHTVAGRDPAPRGM